MKLERRTCPKCGYETAITKRGKWVRHAVARGGWAIRGSSNKDINICPNSGRRALAQEGE